MMRGVLGRRKQPSLAEPSVLVMTMVKDEQTMLPRWLNYYGRLVGHGNLLVIDDESADGSTDDLPCPTIRLHGSAWRPGWIMGRRKMVNSLASAMLAYYDVVIFTDVDEFLVPDPDRYKGLLDYLTRNPHKVIAPIGVNVLHDEQSEPPLDPTRPVLQQRRLVKFAPVMCKPTIKRVSAEWSPGFHGIKRRYQVRPDLLLIHLKYCDVGELTATSAARHDLHVSSRRGGRRSAWAQEAAELAAQLREWTAPARNGTVPEFDPYGEAVSRVVKSTEDGFFHSEGGQLLAMSKRPLRVLPERYRVL